MTYADGRPLPPPMGRHDFPEHGTWGDDEETYDAEIKVMYGAPAPNASEPANRRRQEESGPSLSKFKQMESDALEALGKAAESSLEQAEVMLEGLTTLRAATHAHRQVVVGLRDAVKEIGEMRSVFQRSLDRDTDRL